MNLQQKLSELMSLTVTERLHIIEVLWNSIDANEPMDISPSQLTELDRRLDAYEANPKELLTLDQVLDQLREKR